MKRFVLGKLFIISAALIVLSFISCNQNLKEENGMGKVVISLGNTARSLNSEGLPILDKDNTTIIITVGGESEHHHHTHRIYYGSKISVEFPIGTEITVTVIVSTPAGVQWRGEKTLTVAAGVNNVSLELSKTPSYVQDVGFSLNGEQLSIKIGSKAISPTLAVYSGFTPKIKRDGIGRVYVLYKDKNDSEKYLTRYTVEGEADTAFNKAVSKLSWNNQNFMNNIENIAVDTETGNIFLIEKEGILPAGFRIYCITKEAENFKYYSGNPSGVKVKAAAAYNGTLFLAGIKDNDTKLLAYKTELKTVGERNELTLAPAGETVIATISPEGQSGKTDCNDIHADDTGVYVLLSSTSLKGNIYSVGQINSYEYDYNNGSFGTNVKTAGRTTMQLENGGIAYDNRYKFLSKPIAFIGWYDDYLHIADDGINIVYKEASENFRVDGNKNKGAEFNKTTNNLAIYDLHYDLPNSDITWYEEHSAYKQPNTPVLSWEKGTHGMKYWTSAYGKEAFSNENKLWESTDPSIKPTDIFCYDQDGNLYIVYIKDNDKMVRRFELKYDGSYDTANTQSITLDNEPTAIAVDISNGKNCLYYAYEKDNNSKSTIKKYEWSNNFTTGKISNVITETAIEFWIGITALAANKDGLFAAIKNIDSSNNIYKLTVKKYEKDGSATTCEVFTHKAENSHSSNSSYDSYTGAINALQIRNNILYGIMSEVTQHNTYGGTQYSVDGFKNGSRLYGFGGTKESLTKSELINKNCDDSKSIGYGFYRFIGVQENKLVIASDGAWSILSPECINNIDRVFIYNTTSKAFEVEDWNKSNAKYTLHVVKK